MATLKFTSLVYEENYLYFHSSETTKSVIEKSSVSLNNYDKLQFLDEKSRSFLEQINVTNLIDRLTFSEFEVLQLLENPHYCHLNKDDLMRVYRNRGI